MAEASGPAGEVRYSPAIQAKASVDILLGGAVDFTWNSYCRAAYQRAAEALEAQIQQLVRNGSLDAKAAAELAVAQRNALVIEMQKPLTPFGKFYSEVLKPAKNLPSLQALLARKGTYEAVLAGSARSRGSVNKLAFVARSAGPALIVIDIVATIVIIENAPPDERARMAAREAGGAVGSIVVGRYGGWVGAWAGVTTFELLGSPTLVIPIVGEITEGTLAIVGGTVGFFFGGWLGWAGGQAGADYLWSMAPIVWSGG
jgi:hypothetical protein